LFIHGFFRKSLISAFAFCSAKAKPQEPEVSVAGDAFTEFKHLLLPITDRNPYLSEGTRQVGHCDALQFYWAWLNLCIHSSSADLGLLCFY